MLEWEMFSLAVSLIKVYEAVGFLLQNDTKGHLSDPGYCDLAAQIFWGIWANVTKIRFLEKY